ncbi:probable CCR4-associated factor 1 homolog 9 [Solanum stenotomum]|uniref:probable CCR4-associated factor 1 homolog 9 n=1 Tax=Solanum stenotomum TaxID=172797 RepID=UPI0020D031FA|nr:probable CCR4-associated factor 1 homolog 9 [Solanum stenotomum]
MDVNGVDPNRYPILIREVWADNLKKTFEEISDSIDKFPYISMDTEYPGRIYNSPVPFSQQSPAEKYNVLKLNVDELKLIQVGITLSDANGNLPELVIKGERFRVVWQFNFSDFNRMYDPYVEASIQLLVDSGIDLQRNLDFGIRSIDFGELLMSSGLVCNDSVSWVTFQGEFDIAFLLKILRGRNLPDSLDEFFEFVKMFFGDKLYDVKRLTIYIPNLHGGLAWVAENLGLAREAGRQHQAGSDSLLTCHIFYSMRNGFEDGVPDAGVLHGLT